MHQKLLPSVLLCFAFILIQCKTTQQKKIAYHSPTLKILEISPNSFVHISYLETESFGKVACNGLVYLNNREAVVIDTPINEEVSLELIKWVAEQKLSDVTSVVTTHFHADCLAGLAAFHKLGIPSFGHNQTLQMAAKKGFTPPQIGFDETMELTVGESTIVNRYFGEAHTKDNIVCYVPQEQLLFGGCMVKSLKAGKGNLEDANVLAWPQTIAEIQKAYPSVKTVIPGHGSVGGIALLAYTKSLFSTTE